ncbi:hypothetical protein ACLF3G_19245 [Falsiroseomonas sp. HC035]|uniref:hypothetical protein n=1 Tax=Falsiroseomonas sp. HC035 TaxID=3390999 RepID=UPI003D31984C
MSLTHFSPSSFGTYGPPPDESGVFYDPVLKLGLSWLEPPRRADRRPTSTVALAEAVAGIVGIAAARARDAGDFAALRNAVERALMGGAAVAEAGIDPREARSQEPPAILDMELGREAEGLRALMGRQAAR